MMISDVAVSMCFECQEIEAKGEFPRINLSAEILLGCRGEIHHIDTDAIRQSVLEAVRLSTVFKDRVKKSEAAE